LAQDRLGAKNFVEAVLLNFLLVKFYLSEESKLALVFRNRSHGFSHITPGYLLLEAFSDTDPI